MFSCSFNTANIFFYCPGISFHPYPNKPRHHANTLLYLYLARWKENRERTPSQSQTASSHSQTVTTFQSKGLKVFRYSGKARGGDCFSFSREILDLNAQETALSEWFAPPLCWVLQEASDIWDLTAHIIFTLKVRLCGVCSYCGGLFRKICKPSVHFELLKFRSVNWQNVLLPL